MEKTDTLRISPLPHMRAKMIPVGVLKSGGKFYGEKDARVIYTDSAAPALKLARAKGGTAVIVRTAGATRWVKFSIQGVDYFPGAASTDPEQIIGWRDYCYALGISARSVQAMAFYLMRQTLAGYFDTSRGTSIPFGQFPSGARQHCKPGLYRNVIQSDITAAYLWGIGKLTPAKMLTLHRGLKPETICSYPGSWALVKYRFSEVPMWGPLPHFSEKGFTVYPEKMSEWSPPVLLSSGDLQTGVMMGVRFRVLRSWIAAPGTCEPFRDFMHEIWRQRTGSAFPALAKQAGNTLWGNFCASADLAQVTFNAGTGSHRIKSVPRRPALCLPIGYSVIGKLRSRLYQEAISTGTIHAHTDGVMGDVLHHDDEYAPGSWRATNRFTEVEILSPSWYRVVKQSGEVVYKTAGRKGNTDVAARQFAHHRDRFLGERSSFSRALSNQDMGVRL